RSWTTFRCAGQDGSHRGEDAGKGDYPDGPAQGPELNRASQEDEASGQEAQPDKPSEGSVRSTTHGSFISEMRISVESGCARESSRKVSSAPRRCARVGAGRSAEDRLLCKQEVLGSNPSRSTPVPYLPRFKSTFTTVPDFGFGNVCLALREPLNRAPVRHAVGSSSTRASIP